MAYVTNSRAAAGFGTAIFDRVQGFVEDYKAARALQREFRKTLAELNSLSTRDLADLGLHPSNLRAVAWEAALANAGR